MTLRIDILTLFPEMIRPTLAASMMGIAVEQGAVEFHVRNFRDFAKGVHRKVDDRPFGGGPGMVLKPEPIFDCLESFLPADHAAWPRTILLSPQGRRYDQRLAAELARETHLVLICGHYEGFDERIVTGTAAEEVSIGDYVLTGGELPALVLIDSVVRLLPGVLGDRDSARFESFENGLLDHPHYTRPVEFRGVAVPEVLRSGDHARIAEWRRQEAMRKTRECRPDLLDPQTTTPSKPTDTKPSLDPTRRQGER